MASEITAIVQPDGKTVKSVSGNTYPIREQYLKYKTVKPGEKYTIQVTQDEEAIPFRLIPEEKVDGNKQMEPPVKSK